MAASNSNLKSPPAAAKSSDEAAKQSLKTEPKTAPMAKSALKSNVGNSDPKAGIVGKTQEQGKTASVKEGKQSPKSLAPIPSSATPQPTYSEFGKDSAVSYDNAALTSAQAQNMKATAGGPQGKAATMDEILDQIYLRQYHHGMSDSCSSMSHTGDSVSGPTSKSIKQRLRQRQFGPYATRETLKRSTFYGAFASALILLSIFVIGMAIGLPLIFVKLDNLQDRLDQLKLPKPT